MEILFDIVKIEADLKSLEAETVKPSFWEDTKNSNMVLSKIKTLNGKITKYRNLESEIQNTIEIIDLIKLEYDETLANEVLPNVKSLEKGVEKFEIEILLSGKFDKNNAIITIHPGARWNRSSRLGRDAL